MSDFADRVALVTGAASGIGAAVAMRLAAGGAYVYCGDLNPERAAVTFVGPNTQAISLDVREEAAWAGAIDQARHVTGVELPVDDGYVL